MNWWTTQRRNENVPFFFSDNAREIHNLSQHFVPTVTRKYDQIDRPGEEDVSVIPSWNVQKQKNKFFSVKVSDISNLLITRRRIVRPVTQANVYEIFLQY